MSMIGPSYSKFFLLHSDFDIDEEYESALPVLYFASDAMKNMRSFHNFLKKYAYEEKSFCELCRSCNLDKHRWDHISIYVRMTDRVIRKFSSFLDWKMMTSTQTLNQKTIEDFADKIDWSKLAQHQHLSSKFIDKYADRLDWRDVSRNCGLTKDVIVKHSDKIVWHILDMNKNTSEKNLNAARAMLRKINGES